MADPQETQDTSAADKAPEVSPPADEKPKAKPKRKPAFKPQMGMFVEFCQRKYGGGEEWMPFLVTHVHSAKVISGVAFNGKPAAISFRRGAMEFDNVHKGSNHRQWRPPKS